MTLTYDYLCFHCDFTGKPTSTSSTSCYEQDPLAFKMHFEDVNNLMDSYRVPTHYMSTDATLSPDTVKMTSTFYWWDTD